MDKPSVTNYCVFAFNYYHLLPEERQQRFSDLEETVGSREVFLATLLSTVKVFIVGKKKGNNTDRMNKWIGRQMKFCLL